MLIFVYGTLKQGYGNNTLLRRATYIRTGVLEGYMAYQCGFPVAMPDACSSLSGEFYDIGSNEDILYNLDRLEGEGTMYIRETIKTEDSEFSVYRGLPHVYSPFMIGHFV